MPFSGRRFRRRQYRNGIKLHPAVIVGICLAAAVVITLVVGNLLKLWLDDETFQKLTTGKETEQVSEAEDPTNVRKVNAYPFVLGDELETVLGKTAVSVSVNAPDGTVQYTSEVTAHLGLVGKEEVSLYDTLGALNGFVPYVSGIFYPQALVYENADLRYAAIAEESALLREFLRAGGSEILLCGLPLTAENMDRVIPYLETVKYAAGDAPVGVAVPLSVASAADGWKMIADLLKVCDFCALDVTAEPVDETDAEETGVSPSAERLLTDSAYYVSGYGMRLLISESQQALLSTLERKIYPNFQVARSFAE